jgi:hypothetical protein
LPTHLTNQLNASVRRAAVEIGTRPRVDPVHGPAEHIRSERWRGGSLSVVLHRLLSRRDIRRAYSGFHGRRCYAR